MLSLKERILSQRPRTKEVYIPEWGFSVTIKEMSVKQRVELNDLLIENARAVEAHRVDPTQPSVEPIDEYLAHIAYSLVDENGDQMFSIDDLTNMEQLPYSFAQTMFREVAYVSRAALLEEIEVEKKD